VVRSAWLAVLTVLTLAFVGARHIPFVALAILLLAETVLAFATFEMLILAHFFLEGENVALQNVTNRVFPLILEVFVVVANVHCCFGALLALAGRSAGGSVPQALAVELEAFGVLAFAPHALLNSRLLV
jgi:hypothetical protein